MKQYTKMGIFCILLSIILVCMNSFVFVDVVKNTSFSKFYEEKNFSIDVVSVGNSTVRCGIDTMKAWNNYNITSYNVCDAPTHPEVILIAIEEIARTQSPKVVYIDLNGLSFQSRDEQDIYVEAYISAMPDCEEKEKLMEKYSYVKTDMEEKDKELFSYHNEFRNPDYWFSADVNNLAQLKGFIPLNYVEEQDSFVPDNTVLPLPEDGEYYLYKILELCKNYPDINFIFGKMPRILNQDTALETYMLRSAIPVINEYGFTYIEWEQYVDDMGLDRYIDLADEHHLNFGGSQKFTTYFFDYLVSNFNLNNLQHDEDVVENFDTAYETYLKMYGNLLA